jgi:hypothetical protein
MTCIVIFAGASVSTVMSGNTRMDEKSFASTGQPFPTPPTIGCLTLARAPSRITSVSTALEFIKEVCADDTANVF